MQNAIYYELSAISEYDALVDYVSQHYQDDNMVEPIWKYIKKYKHSFKNRHAYEKLRSVVNEFRTLRIEQSEGFIDKILTRMWKAYIGRV